MLADELQTLLAGAPPETLRLIRAARERDATILQEYLDAGVSRTPNTDAMHRIQTEIFQMGPPPVSEGPTAVKTTPPRPHVLATAAMTYDIGPDWIRCRRCGRTSHAPKDVSEKYCGHCHKFHQLDWPTSAKAPPYGSNPST